jgi:hypothetical protein
MADGEINRGKAESGRALGHSNDGQSAFKA